MNPNPLEKMIEEKVCAYARSLHCLVYKFTSPSRRSVPDRLFITPGGRIFWIEFKRLKEKPTSAQQAEITKMQKQGAFVYVADSVEAGKKMIDFEVI